MLVMFLFVLVFLFSPCHAIREAMIDSSAGNVVNAESKLETYIILLKKPGGVQFVESSDLDRWYRSYLPDSNLNPNQQRMVYAYRSLVTGFAAKLTPDEVKTIERKEGFVSAHPQKILHLHTTHTPSFLGLRQNSGLWNLTDYGKGMIIAMLDTGVGIEHPSFSHKGMPPPPAKWKGVCEFNDTSCNNKIIGARYYKHAGDSPHDDHGHGTHTASIAAGRPVKGVDYDGQLNGTAEGIAPLAHLAIYKVCDAFGGCAESDVLAGMEHAVQDGVDVLSLSLGYGSLNYTVDPIAIGAFAAVQRGLFVSCSAGNGGPRRSSLSNEAPWILTVGAGTVDRSIQATVQLGDNAEFNGQSFYQPKDFPATPLPLVYAGAKNASSAFCMAGSLIPADVKGKMVLCEIELGSDTEGVEKGLTVKAAGGAAMILMNDRLSGNATAASFHVLPASHVTYADGLRIKTYINSTTSPMASLLFKGTVYGVPYAPQVAMFSSRGPSQASPGILKPDILGPGDDILAAWPFPLDNAFPSTNSNYTFELLSGTSMSCPHLAGVATLLKSSHPDWSPAAIRSAILTTADMTNLGGTPITDQRFVPANIFATGSGHVNPSKANNPGLVYDIQPDEYIAYLCGLGRYTDKEISLITNQDVTCSSNSSIPEAELNYPTFAIRLIGSSPQRYTRTVTNVGPANSSYSLEILAPQGVNVGVEPDQIFFTEVNQKATYSITLSTTANTIRATSIAQGYLRWFSDQHSVRSAIAVIFE